MIDQPKDFKVRNEKNEYLSFDFDARTGSMNPLWGPITCSYPFTFEEAARLANVHEAEIVPPIEWKAEYQRFMDECKARSVKRMVAETMLKVRR